MAAFTSWRTVRPCPSSSLWRLLKGARCLLLPIDRPKRPLRPCVQSGGRPAAPDDFHPSLSLLSLRWIMQLSFRRLLVVVLGASAVSWGCAKNPYAYDGP